MRVIITFAAGLLLALHVAPADAQNSTAQTRSSRQELRVDNIRSRDRQLWYSGHWYHGWYAGQPGWWWVLGRSYYYYAAPIYPYPQAFETATAADPIPDLPTPAPAAYWNFCAEPAGYYPYVQTCATRWVRVLPSAAVPLAPPPPLPWPG